MKFTRAGDNWIKVNKFSLRVRRLLNVVVTVGLPKHHRRKTKGERVYVAQHFRDVKLKVGHRVRVGDLKDNVEGFLGLQNEGVGYVVLNLQIVLCSWLFLVAVRPEPRALGSHLLLGNPGVLNLDQPGEIVS